MGEATGLRSFRGVGLAMFASVLLLTWRGSAWAEAFAVRGLATEKRVQTTGSQT